MLEFQEDETITLRNHFCVHAVYSRFNIFGIQFHMLLLFILLLLTRFTAKYMVNTTKLLLSKEIQILPNVNTRLFMPFMKTRLKLRTKSTLTGNVF